MKKYRGAVLYFLFVLFLACGSIFLKQNASRLEEEEEEGSIPKQDRMDLAVRQEFEITHDLRTHTVPRERLLAAYLYAEKLRQVPKYGQSPQAAISGMNWTERGPSNIGGRTRALIIDPNDVTRKKVWA